MNTILCGREALAEDDSYITYKYYLDDENQVSTLNNL